MSSERGPTCTCTLYKNMWLAINTNSYFMTSMMQSNTTLICNTVHDHLYPTWCAYVHAGSLIRAGTPPMHRVRVCACYIIIMCVLKSVSIPLAAIELITRLLQVSRKSRFTAHQALNHAWLNVSALRLRVSLTVLAELACPYLMYTTSWHAHT